MSTYLHFADKLVFEISRFECTTTGVVELVNGKYKFSLIDLYPSIYLTDEKQLAAARLAVEKTEKYCLVSNSINAELTYHPEVLMEPDLKHSSRES